MQTKENRPHKVNVVESCYAIAHSSLLGSNIFNLSPYRCTDLMLDGEILIPVHRCTNIVVLTKCTKYDLKTIPRSMCCIHHCSKIVTICISKGNDCGLKKNTIV